MSMPMRKGERYACEDPSCACEIEVVRGTAPQARPVMEMRTQKNPRCFCGQEMLPLDGASSFDPADAVL